MKYEFGIMSSRFELESNDNILAKVAMCLFFKQNIPIAIYKPKEKAVMPIDILEKNFAYTQNHQEELITIINSIKELELENGKEIK